MNTDQLVKAIKNLRMDIPGFPYQLILNVVIIVPTVASIPPFIASVKCNLILSIASRLFYWYNFFNRHYTATNMNYTWVLKSFNFDSGVLGYFLRSIGLIYQLYPISIHLYTGLRTSKIECNALLEWSNSSFSMTSDTMSNYLARLGTPYKITVARVLMSYVRTYTKIPK